MMEAMESKSPTVGNLESDETASTEEVTTEGDDGIANEHEDNPRRKRAFAAEPTATSNHQPNLNRPLHHLRQGGSKACGRVQGTSGSASQAVARLARWGRRL